MASSLSSADTAQTPSRLCPAIVPLRINLEEMLKEQVGSFRLSFVHNGTVCTIGDLDVPGTQSEQIKTVSMQQLTSTPLGSGPESPLPSHASPHTPHSHASSPHVASSHVASPRVASPHVSLSHTPSPVLKEITSGPLLSDSSYGPPIGVRTSPAPYKLASYPGFNGAPFPTAYSSSPIMPSPLASSYDSTEEEEPDMTVVNLYEAFDKNALEKSASKKRRIESEVDKAPVDDEANYDPLLWLGGDELHPMLRDSRELVGSVLDQLKITPRGDIGDDIHELRDLIWWLKPQIFRSLAAVLINLNYPTRRRRFPYQHGKSFYSWPKGIRYRDPAHLRLSERLAITIWAYLSPSHRFSNIQLAHASITKRDPTQDFEEINRVVLRLRCKLWGEKPSSLA